MHQADFRVAQLLDGRLRSLPDFGFGGLESRVEFLQHQIVFDLQRVGEPRGPRRAFDSVGQFGHVRQHRIDHGNLGPGVGKAVLLDLPVHEELEVLRSFAHELAVLRRAVLADRVVGIRSPGELDDVNLEALLEKHVQRARGCLRAGGVPVVGDANPVGVARQKPRLARRERGAQRGDHVVEAVLHQRSQVHVSLDHDGKAFTADRITSLIESVEMVPLGVRGSLGRVDVFGLRIGRQRAPAEGHDTPLDVPDREDQPVAEAIVLAASALARRDQPRFEQVGGSETLRQQVSTQRLPIVRGVAQTQPLDRFLVETARGQVLAAGLPGVFAQQLLEEDERGRVDLEHALAIVPAAAPHRGQRDAETGRQGFDGLAEIELVVDLDELEDVPAGLTAEAIKELALGVDREGRRFFLVERTEPLEAATRPLEGNVIRNDLDDIARDPYGLDEVRCKRSTHP